MIQVEYIRCGLHVVAVTINDFNEVHIGVAFTKRTALKRLCKGLEKLGQI